MQIRINKEWVIFSSKNALGILLAKIPEKMQEADTLDTSKISNSSIKHYSTVAGAIKGLFKYAVIDTDIKSLSEFEDRVERLASECTLAFSKNKDKNE